MSQCVVLYPCSRGMTEENSEHLSQNGWYPSLDLNLGLPEYEAKRQPLDHVALWFTVKFSTCFIIQGDPVGQSPELIVTNQATVCLCKLNFVSTYLSRCWGNWAREAAEISSPPPGDTGRQDAGASQTEGKRGTGSESLSYVCIGTSLHDIHVGPPPRQWVSGNMRV